MILFARILTTYVNGLSFRAAPSVIKVRVHNLSSTGTEGQYFIHTHTHTVMYMYSCTRQWMDSSIWTFLQCLWESIMCACVSGLCSFIC